MVRVVEVVVVVDGIRTAICMKKIVELRSNAIIEI